MIVINRKTNRSVSLVATVLALWLSCMGTVLSETTIPGELFVFPNIQASNVSGSGVTDAITDNTTIEAQLDLFYSYEKDDFLFLTEYFVSRDENEFERVQIGWLLTKEDKLWFGRFHNPLGIWNTSFHHGTYLQTSISRPAITAFEDDGGVIPIHVTGLLLDMDRQYGDSRLNINLAAGASLTMESGVLQPMDFFSPGGETYHENFTTRLNYYPDALSSSRIGAFAGYSRIEGDGVGAHEIVQIQSGVFAEYEYDNLKLLSSVFFVDNDLRFAVAPNKKGNFTNAYIQLDYGYHQNWSVFTRFEDTFNNKNDPFLALIPSFIDQRQLLGLRFDMYEKQALTLELRRDHKSSGRVNQIMMQWSALLP